MKRNQEGCGGAEFKMVQLGCTSEDEMVVVGDWKAEMQSELERAARVWRLRSW